MENKNTQIGEIRIPRWSELPEIDLYMDQVVTLINSKLTPFMHNEGKNEEKNNAKEKGRKRLKFLR